MRRRTLREGLTKSECNNFSFYLSTEFRHIQRGKKTIREVVCGFGRELGRELTPEEIEKLVVYARKKVKKLQQRSEEGGWDLWESRLNSIIKESIDKVMNDEKWGNPESQERQLGDEYFKMTMDFCKEHDIRINPHQLIPLLRDIVAMMLENKGDF